MHAGSILRGQLQVIIVFYFRSQRVHWDILKKSPETPNAQNARQTATRTDLGNAVNAPENSFVHLGKGLQTIVQVSNVVSPPD